ncbi:unnamed protein product [Rotaria magnacalcarata]|uniref:Transposase Tc1-like domain-containing protein n=2 Tax=Rotaria magnacalcarata TaxID=392030 RepID=A0A814V8I9_9BILA|nr:unnamed protein product [Rotaria magnacalcarata]CAF2066021.1 unnamed protein product [Rotaria magnacalcarata]CAF3909126.1 unnamed protein product [Rotaria magnacalcarata]CAF5067924.1 unnamed protein product [Rotaria magnacalcarata]
MAPRKYKEYSNDLRELAIKHFQSGVSERNIAQKVLIPRTSVHYIISKYKSTKCIGNIIGRGRKRKTTVHVDRCIRRKIMANRRISSSAIKTELLSELGIAVFESTIKRTSHEAGLFGRVARKKPYVNKLNRTRRLEYARTHQEKPLGFWNRIIWSDESKFTYSAQMER